MQEDHVSMGWSAARKLRRSVDGLTRVLAIELLTAARALDLRAPLLPGPATSAVVAGLRASVPGPGPDRHLSPEIEAAVSYVRTGRRGGRRRFRSTQPVALTQSSRRTMARVGFGRGPVSTKPARRKTGSGPWNSSDEVGFFTVTSTG